MKYSLSLMLKVARMYYYHGISQKEIAKQLGVSIPTVSRILKETLKNGIVQIKIENKQGYCKKLEKALKKKYSLIDAVVIRTGNILDNRYLKSSLGKEGANLFKKVAKAGALIGLGPGETIMEMVLSFSTADVVPGITIVPLMGGWGLYQLEWETNRLVSIIGTTLGCRYYFLNSPALVSSPKVKDIILNEYLIHRVAELWEHLDVAIFSIGPEIEDGILPSLMTPVEIKTAVSRGAVSDILGILIDEEGKPLDIEFNRKIVSIPIEILKKVPIRLGIGGGSRKIRGLMASLRSGIVNMIVTDEKSAEVLLDTGEGGES